MPISHKWIAVVIMLLALSASIEAASFIFWERLVGQAQEILASEQNQGSKYPGGARSQRDTQRLKLQSLGSHMTGPLGPVSFERAQAEMSRVEALKAEPASAGDWLELAKLRIARGAANEALSAFDMSELTEPREIDLRFRRMAFYLSIWETLPVDRQRRALKELCDIAPFMNDKIIHQLKVVVETWDANTRRAIKEGLVARETEEKWWMKAIGL